MACALFLYNYFIPLIYFQIFIDRDPGLFAVILNYLRTKDVDVRWDQYLVFLLPTVFPSKWRLQCLIHCNQLAEPLHFSDRK